MPRSSQYKHYMQRIDEPGYTTMDLENEPRWEGLRYLKATGFHDIGKPKNIYTEEYADSDALRVYLPLNDNYANEATVITMIFIVIGNAETRRNTIEDFCDYVRKGVHLYYDTARQMEFKFIVKDEIKISDEKWHGSQPYIELTIPMQNINGKTQHRPIEDTPFASI